MRLVIISDTHDALDEMSIPEGDVLIHCGDFSNTCSDCEIQRFNIHFGKLNFQCKIIVPGNHDYRLLAGSTDSESARAMLDESFHILDDQLLELGGLKIFGSGWRPRMMALPKRKIGLLARVFGSPVQSNCWEVIPHSMDVLITHGPPSGILDLTETGSHAGCEVLRQRVEEAPPRLHCFGHIHHSYGIVRGAKTVFANAASVNELYQPINKPIVIDIDKNFCRTVD